MGEQGTTLENRLIDATLRCVARWGIAKTTLDDVAREARCGRATIYRTFEGGKASVLLATLQHELARCMATVEDEVNGCDSLEDVLVAGTTSAATFIAEHDALQFLLAHEPDAVLPHVAFDKLARVFDAAAVFAQPHLARFLPGAEVPRAAEWVTRVVLSYALAPTTLDLRVERDARRLVNLYLMPALLPRAAVTQP
jgi:AcrR family transcriptional regulator